MKVEDHNRAAWNKLVNEGNEWTRPVSSEVIAALGSSIIVPTV